MTPSEGGDPTTMPGGPPGIDPTIDWRRVPPAQFATPGDQVMNDVVVFGSRLVGAGSSLTFELPEAAVALEASAAPASTLDWEIKVVAVDLDAAATIAAHDPENEPAPDGVRYVMVTVEVTDLSSAGARNVDSDLDWHLMAQDGTPIARAAYCGRLPEAFRSGPFDPGAIHVGNKCFAMPEDRVADDMVLGLVPAGTSLGQLDAAIWTSDDAESWRPVDDPDLVGPGSEAITRLAVAGDWVYAAGRADADDADAAIWRSADGREWDRIDAPALAGAGDQSVADLVVVDGRLMAAGSVAEPLAPGEATEDWDEGLLDDWLLHFDLRRGALWASDDGLSWNLVDVGTAGSSLRRIDKIVAHHDRLSLVGQHIDGDLAVVSSSDGVTWQAADLERRDTEQWTFTTAALLGDRLWVLGTPGAIATDDGTTWSLESATWVADVTPAGDRLLGVGRAGGYQALGPIHVYRPRPWLTVIDAGGTRSGVVDAGLLPEGAVGELAGVTVWGDRYVAVGMALADGTQDAGVWIGGGPEGSVAAELSEYEIAPANPATEYPPVPTADLLRYDGSAWQVVHHAVGLGEEAATSLSAFDLFTVYLAAGDDGSIWAASRAAGVYRLRDGTWAHFDRADGLPSIQIADLEVDAGGTPWVGTAAGPAFFDGERWVGAQLPPSIAIPRVLELAPAPDGTLWVATLGGLARWDGAVWTGFTSADGLPSSVVLDVQVAAGGVWAITPAGLGHWDGNGWRAFRDPAYRPYFEAYPYAFTADEGIYLAPGAAEGSGGYSADFLRLGPDGTTRVFMNDHAYKATTVALDGTVYVGTELSGLYLLGATTRQVGSLGDVDLYRIGELWAAPNGTVWMDSAPGLFEIHASGTVICHTEVPGLGYPLQGHERSFSDGAVQDLAFAADGSVWALTNQQHPEW